MLKSIFRYVYLVMSWAFLLGVVYQTYTAGLAALPRTIGWSTHASFGLLLLLAALIQLLLILPARLPRPAGWVSLSLFATILIQVMVVSDRASTASALHPVLALFTFSMALWLASAAVRAVREPALTAAAHGREHA